MEIAVIEKMMKIRGEQTLPHMTLSGKPYNLARNCIPSSHIPCLFTYVTLMPLSSFLIIKNPA